MRYMHHKALTPRQIITAMVILLLIAAGGTLISGCEETVSADGIPYIQRLIVEGTISPGKTVDSIRIMRTLPLDRPYNPEAARINDALVTVTVDGQRFTLVPSGNGYYGTPEITVESGKHYRLDVEWNGKHATATTYAPYPVDIDEALYQMREVKGRDSNSEPLYFYDFIARFKPLKNQVYALSLEATLGQGLDKFQYRNDYDQYREHKRNRDTLITGQIKLVEEEIFQNRQFTVESALLYVHTFDAPYYDFITTYYSADDLDDSPFGTGGETIRWNVEGDGIGLFIGQTLTVKPIQ